MSGDAVQVIPEDLTVKATQIRNLSWPPMTAQPPLVSPDALLTTAVAIANLAVNSETMWAYQEYGRLEGARLAQTLDNVSAAYADVDKISAEAIDNAAGGVGSSGAPGDIRYPRGVDLPAPPHPPRMPIPKGRLVSEQMLFPPDAQRALEAGDHGTSLRTAAELWRSNAQSLTASAQQFETNSLLWEGEAADAAYAKFNAYREWLIGLAGSWKRLAGEADRIADAHWAAKRDNRPIAERFAELQHEIAEKPASADNLRKTLQMAALQNQSEEIRNQYARDGQPYQIEPEDPPSPVISGIPVTVDDDRRARGRLPGKRLSEGPRAGAAGNGGSPGGGEHQAVSGQRSISPLAAAERTDQGTPQSGSQGGGLPGAGRQGAGPPGGGQPGAGLPISTKGAPKLPIDPRVRPATSGSGGSGGAKFGGAGSGAGSMVPGSPMQPAVRAETVAPVTAPVAPVVPAATGAAAGGMAAGGMAPMMHTGKGDTGIDKKRHRQLSPDEGLYTEDRPWTEAVIGNRVRRRAAPADVQKESQ